jgi:hypothetical protein
MKKPAATAGFFSKRVAGSDRPAAVLVVRLLGRICDHIGLHFLHLATTSQELFHGLGQGVAFLVLGFDTRQLIDRYRCLGLAFGGRNRRITAVVFSDVFCRCFQTFFGFVVVAYFEVVVLQIIVADVVTHDIGKSD